MPNTIIARQPSQSSLDKVIQHFEQLHPVSKDFQEDFFQNAFEIEVTKNTIILKEGDLCQHVFFIQQGLLRAFSRRAKKEIITWIIQEDNFATSISGLYGISPSRESIQAIEPTVLTGVTFDTLQRWYIDFPETNILLRKIFEIYYQGAEERAFLSRIGNAMDKYKYFADQWPGLMNRVPLAHIASFLGIRLETLSRVRKKQLTLHKHVSS
jgi:CRP-like cAMP-binding protein